MLPGKYDWFNFVAGGILISGAGRLAWVASKQFAKASGKEPTWKNVAMAPPAVVWIVVIVLFFLYGFTSIVHF